jgi:hypothetical protein
MAHLDKTGALISAQVKSGHSYTPRVIAILGQSNAGRNTDWSQGDPGLRLNQTYAQIYISSKYGIGDPITWQVNRGRESLQPSAAINNANMGPELAAGRLLNERAGLTEMLQFSVSSTGISEWLPGSGLPLNPAGGPDLFAQAVAYIRAVEAGCSGALAAIIWIQGENDAMTANDAAAYQTRLGTFITAMRDEFGQVPFVISKLNDSAVADHVATVRAAQVAYAASDPLATLVNVDDIPMLDAFHYDAFASASIGNRLASAALDALDYPGRPVTGSTVAFIGSEPGVFGTGALTPRSRPDLVAGDLEILVTTANYAAGADSLSDAQGFSLLQEGTSIWTVVNSNARIYTRTVTQAALDANGGIMPSPTVADSNDKNAAKIFAFRGPNGSVTVGASAVSVNNTADTPVSCPGVTTDTANNLIVSFVTGWAGSSNRTISGLANSSLSGLALVHPSIFSIAAEGLLVQMITGTKALAGAVSATTGALDLYAVQANFTVALKP